MATIALRALPVLARHSPRIAARSLSLLTRSSVVPRSAVQVVVNSQEKKVKLANIVQDPPRARCQDPQLCGNRRSRL